MALFGTLNVAGPANRGATIQSLAQNAAQSVMRRQRLKALLQQATSAGAHGGPGTPFQSSLNGRAVGTRGSTIRPDIPSDALAGMARAAGHSGHMPGGVFGRGGGGFDFGAIPAPVDHSQSPASVGASPFHSAPIEPAPNAPIVGGGFAHAGSSAPAPTPGPAPSAPGGAYEGIQGAQGATPGNIHGWISIGGGLFYDPETDMVRGGAPAMGNGLFGPDGKF